MKQQHNTHNTSILENAPLGKRTTYSAVYQPDLLYPIPRSLKREEIHIAAPLPFYGDDIWNAYELSWLNPKGKPMVACAKIIIPCTSPYLIEHKSLKLYLNSLNYTSFQDDVALVATIERDLSQAAGQPVRVTLQPPTTIAQIQLVEFEGRCLDDLDITCDTYTLKPEYLTTEKSSAPVTEILYSHLLKSDCLITGQPDWGSIQIDYRGNQINHEGLLKYIISYRNHIEFAEQCVERFYMDIMRHCQPQALTVYARYTRRGGIDINPIRSSSPLKLTSPNKRLFRQ